MAADGWYSWHTGKVIGPVAADELRRLAATGVILPDDLLWPETGDPREAVEVQAALDFTKLPPRTKAPSWLSDVQQALQPRAPRTNVIPDWVADVETAGASSPATMSAPMAVRVAPRVAGTEPPPVLAQQVLTPARALGPARLTLGGMSSVGQARARNEDRFVGQHWLWNDGAETHEAGLLVVADGMGGYQGGDEASALTVRIMLAQVGVMIVKAMGGDAPNGAALAAAVEQAIHEANRVVLQKATTEERYKGMGATAAVALIWDGRAYFGHVGDCRVYLYRANALKQLTEDQTIVARMVALGQLTAEEAEAHDARNEVTQAIGKRPTVEPSRAEEPLARGDLLLLACDGLAAHVDHATLQSVLAQNFLSPQHLATQLVDLADARGGSDNCTVVVAALG
jgi:protein phosphatase